MKETGSWRRFGATALTLCLLAGMPPLRAQEPSANQATLNFVGADIDSVIKAIGHYTRTTFVIDPRVKGTINLVSEKPVSKAQALDLLASALRLQGFAVVKTDGVAKVVPEADAKLQAGPTSVSGVRGDQIATQIFRLNYESANNLVPVLRPLISPNNTINANPGNNTVVITDYADNLKRMGKIIAALDTPSTGDLDIVPIRHAIATDIAAITNRLLEQGGTAAAVPGGEAGKVYVLADPRTNSVIIRAPSAARANLAKTLIAKLDQQTELPGNVHVVYLRNADAVRLAQTLRAVVASDTSAQQPGGGAASTLSQQQPMSASASASGQQGGALGGGQPLQPSQTPAALPAGGAGGFIQADPATNTLIITASEPVYRNLRIVIDQLDARRAQVYVESLIVEVSADKAAEFGVQWLGLSGNGDSAYRVGGGTAFNGGSTATGASNNILALAAGGGNVAPGNGLSVGIFRQINGKLGLGALARALETNANANILSIPNLITLDNEEARIIVGQNVPFITGQFTTSTSGANNPFQTIERRDIGLSLRVRPQVSEGGTIKMAIYQETSTIQSNSNQGPITNKRSIESNVLVDDGQIVVLGGLIQDQVQDGDEKVPGLGDLPGIGNLFKYKTRSRTKTNLMVFLRPTVIRTNEQSVNLVNDRYDYIRGVLTEGQPQPSFALPDIHAPMLPPLQDGRPVGGPMINVLPRQEESVQPTPPATVPTTPAPPPDQNQSRQQ